MQEGETTEKEIESGLTFSQVTERRKRFGSNVLPKKKGRTPLKIYIEQFKSPLIYVILTAGIISFILGEYNDVYIIMGVVILDTVIGFFQEYNAEKAVAALKRLLKTTATVIRDGKKVDINTAEVVPDDIVVLDEGDKISADGTLVEAVRLTVNEAILTGESEAVAKDKEDTCYMGTTVFSGRGLMKVTSTGKFTELGKIATSLEEMEDEDTPLQTRLKSFSKVLTYVVIAVSVFILAIGVLSGISFLKMLEVSIVLAIAAIPEGLIIAVTMILALGMRSILRRKGLVKRLLAVETLGSVTVICTDKTGTLTEGIMRVVKTDFKNREMAQNILVLCNNLTDSTEAALWNYAKEDGIDTEEICKEYRRISEIPFSSEKKYMLTVNLIRGAQVGLLKGAPEVVFQMCNLSDSEKGLIMAELEEWANSGLRLLALSYKDKGDPNELSSFTWSGLVGIEDPVRSSVKDAISLCRRAGIKVKIITGDYRGTAEKVAKSLGLTIGPNQVLDGKQLATMSEDQLANVIDDVKVFYRVSPGQKLKIVSALQSHHEVVAMIGDGVNDAPALKKSNIGVSVGNGTDVAQETASLILLDNNFSTLVSAIEEGRIIFENIKKVVAYVLSNSFAEILTIFGAMILRWPSPLSVVQILWIHLICDGPSDIVLGFERSDDDLMDDPPKSVKESILDKRGKILIPAISTMSSSIALLLYWYFWNIHGDVIEGTTVVFTILAIQSLVYVFSYRSFRHSIFRSKNFFSNKFLFAAVIFGFAQQFAALYIPGLNTILNVVPLELGNWIIILGIVLSEILLIEVVKYIFSPKKVAIEKTGTNLKT
ncbi:MAG: P-type Ca2+ transporter type [Thermoproteota archaeon]|nr:P-type Ca2+ transporter type [Thermoproteota archaeon]